ncbi:MAG: DUF4383 domain-containing protein [Pseudonocardia sp.]
MSVLHPRPGPHPVHTIHRVSAAAIGGFLCVFGGLGLAPSPPMLTTVGAVVLGLATNGLLAVISLVVGVALLGSAAVGGPAASTISVVLGGLFLLSGIVNGVLVGTSMNVLAFQLSNVLFSLLVGGVLIITGAYGRITGGLPLDNPYHRDVPDDALPAIPEQRSAEVLGLAAELAEAERAYALHYATPEQIRRLEKVWVHRVAEDRRHAWRESIIADNVGSSGAA